MRARLASVAMAKFWSGVALVVAFGCTTHAGHLHRGQRLYQQDDYESALAIWRVLERDMGALSAQNQARYAYLRGMTGYQLGFKQDARHWLALAATMEGERPESLSARWRDRVATVLDELNRDVYARQASQEP